ncbi:MAG: translation initiation factor IF-3 [Candidatus Saccharibacteria bacterium]|nr:translation initiation factor IF-3 [Candidatus Saccharibacteria bacterium]
MNEAIIAKELRVIDENGQSFGIVSKNEALKMAKESEADLVIVSPQSNPPVAKIIDWGKYTYQNKKKKQKNLKANNNRSTDLKQMRFGMKISENDLDVKLRKVSKFLEEGSKVKLFVVLRGRELEYKDLGFELAQKLIAKLEGIGIVEQEPRFSGRQINMLIRSAK